MSISGTLKFTDSQGQERALECTGDLERYKLESTGDLVRGQLNVPGDAVDAVQDAMRVQATSNYEDGLMRYSGEVYEQGRDGKSVVEDLPLMVRGLEGANNVMFESKGT